MSLKFPDGSVVGFATKVGVAIPFTEISNAKPAIIKHAAGKINKGDILLIESPWGGIANRVSVAGKADATAGTELLGIDTTDTTMFVEGRGAGAVLIATEFVDFSQQGELTSSGGEPQTYTGKYLEDPQGQEFQVPVGQTARQLSLSLDHDSKLPWYAAAEAVSVKRLLTVFRIKLPDGDTIYESGYLHFNPSMGLNSGQPMKNAANFYLRSSRGTLIEAGA
ncbi:phage tail tube protein [Paenalcaligenes sp. Me131]|uniref:phage tail tube protein n=1 Tax=Paenalcaligenes sp. Me131 TaxID=3392636 RepID=UPI003D2AD0CF